MDHLARERLEQQDFRVFLPEYRECGAQRGAIVVDRKLLFSGYIFINFDVVKTLNYPRINSTLGVRRLLPQHLETPLPLPVGFVEELRVEMRGGRYDKHVEKRVVRQYLPGETVEIESGPFADHKGPLERYHKGHLMVMLALLGRQLEVAIPPEWAKPAPPLEACTGAAAS